MFTPLDALRSPWKGQLVLTKSLLSPLGESNCKSGQTFSQTLFQISCILTISVLIGFGIVGDVITSVLIVCPFLYGLF